jgi:type IV pilus assembly protein PilF
MNFKYLLIAVLAVSLVSCADKADNTAKIDNLTTDATGKPNYEAAALLNIEMGQKYLAQGQVSRAKKKFVHALELKPKLPEAHSAIAYFYETVGDKKEAEAHHLEAIKYGAGKGRFYNNYGTYLCRQKRSKEADRAFNKALLDKQYPKTAEVYENAGLCALQYDEAKAREYLQSSLQHDPHRGLAALELANMEMKVNNPNSALRYLNMFKQTNQPTAKSLWISIQALRKLNRKDDVASAALQLKGLYSESPEYKEFLESTKYERE